MDLNIDDLFEMLSWNSDSETQAKGRMIASQIKSLFIFLQPTGNKSVWENCAKILSEKSDENLEMYLYQLLEWIQDINWPGAFIVLDRMKRFSAKKIKGPLQYCIKQAMTSQDNEWLDYLSMLLDNSELLSVLEEECLMVLKKHRHDFIG